MSQALVGLGANLGDREATLSAAIAALSHTPGVRVAAVSSWHGTKPVGGPAGQPAFLNGVAVLETSLSSDALLNELQRIESKLGRRREAHWGPRTIDLDLLLFDEEVIESPRLTLPHPWLALRRFELAPAVEVAAAWRHPVLGWTLRQLLAHLDTAPNYLALCGIPETGKTVIAGRLAAERGVRPLLDATSEGIEASGGHDPAGPVWGTEIEFLARRQQLLAAQRWATEPGWLVSDFWFGQGLAYASLHLNPVDLERYRERWIEAAGSIIAPKLLVLLDPPQEWMADAEKIRSSIIDLATRPGQGPLLRLRESDTTDVVTQLAVAIDAVQPS